MIYQWKPGSHHRIKPEVAAEVLNELAENGTLNAETLVSVSEDEDSPMHPEFDWVDSVAARNWRLQQARMVINTLVMVDEAEPEKEPIRAFLKIESVNKKQYESTSVLIRSQSGREAMLELAERELESYKAKYATILSWTNSAEDVNRAIGKMKNRKRM